MNLEKDIEKLGNKLVKCKESCEGVNNYNINNTKSSLPRGIHFEKRSGKKDVGL